MNTNEEQNERICRVSALIEDLCDIILTGNDNISFEAACTFIQKLSKEDIQYISETTKFEMDEVIRSKLVTYIQRYQKEGKSLELGTPFEFDIGNVFDKYVKYFRNTFEIFTEKKVAFPDVFQRTFDLIKEMSEHYQIFEKFYMIRSQETSEAILSKTRIIAKNESEKAIQEGIETAVSVATERAVNRATAKAELQAQFAAKSAEEAALKAENAAIEAVDIAVNKKMSEITQKVSESSVTILGIFSGIVLAVVGGLFYSSSVIDNIYHSNFYRVLCIAALAGFVFFNLIIIMFKYIEKIRNHSEPDENNSSNKTKITKLDFAVIVIDIIFVILVFVFAGIQHNYPSNTPSENTECVSVTETEYNFK